MSGVREDRPGLVELLRYVRAGDTVVVVVLDRLGRSLWGGDSDGRDADRAGGAERSLREGIDYSTPTGWMLAGIFAAVTGYERELMHERAADQVRQVRSLRAGGESIADLVRGFRVSRATVYRALGDAVAAVPVRAA